MPDDRVVECLLALCRAAWSLMVNYRLVVEWHEHALTPPTTHPTHPTSTEVHSASTTDTNLTPAVTSANTLGTLEKEKSSELAPPPSERRLSGTLAPQDAGRIRERLAAGRQRLWSDVQLRVRHFLQNVNLSPLDVDQFFAVLELVNRCLFIHSPLPFPSFLLLSLLPTWLTHLHLLKILLHLWNSLEIIAFYSGKNP